MIRTTILLLAAASMSCIGLAQAEGPRVRELILYDAASDAPLGPLEPFASLDLQELGITEFSVVARTDPDVVGSVVFVLDGERFSVENVAPYALAGDSDDGTDFHPWRPEPGTYEFRAMAHAQADAGGAAGDARTVTITVTDGPVSAGDATASDTEPSEAGEREADATEGAQGTAPERERFALHAITEEARDGSLLLSDYGHAVVLAVSLAGVNPNATYPVRLHAGSCAGDGAATLDLEPLHGRRGVSTTVVRPLRGDELGEDRHVRVYDPEDDATVLACGELRAGNVEPAP